MSEPPPEAWWVPDREAATRQVPLTEALRLDPQPAAPTAPAPELPSVQVQPSSPDGRGTLLRAGVAVLAVAVLVGLAWVRFDRQAGTAPATSAAPAPSGLVPVDAATVTATASSTQHPDGGVTYAAVNTLDGDPQTAWNSDGRRDGPGPGITLSFAFAAPVELRTVSVLNGYQKLRRRAGGAAQDLYPLNGRLRRVRVVTDAGSRVGDLTDSRARQTLAAPAGRTGWVRLEVLSVYPSTTYPDLALSEVSFGAAPG